MTKRRTNGTNASRGTNGLIEPFDSQAALEILGAREHNLKVDRLVVPKQSLVVFTGPSGSGKSSLAFDTLYAEGQRRYVESLSAYARQFLGRLERPNVERIRGLSPTIAIEQKTASSNPRSTVGTITEIYDYLRVLYARAGVQHCPTCGKAVRGQSTDAIVREVVEASDGIEAIVLAPVVTHRKGEFRELIGELAARGFVRIRVDGAIHRTEEPPVLDKKKKHTLELVIDRIRIDASSRGRLAEAVESALREGGGEMTIETPDGKLVGRYSANRACCGRAFAPLSPQSFSFNSPLGMCAACNGLGTRTDADAKLIIPDPSLSIRQGAIAPWATAVERGDGWTFRTIDALRKAIDVDLDVPFKKLPAKKQKLVLYGLEEGQKIRMEWGKEGSESHGSWNVRYEGVIPSLLRRYKETTSERMREHYRQYFSEQVCDSCSGRRLREETLFVRVAGKSVANVTSMTVAEARAHIDALGLTGKEAAIAEGVLREIRTRLKFLLDVGLDYLTLDRAGPSLSGGEAQRIRLASQLGSELSGVMYVLDEPSIGLHARDNQRLVATLRHLASLGNSVIVVEHDEETMRASDHLVDFGPGAGIHGGEVVFSGHPDAILDAKGSLTGDYLSGRRSIPMPTTRREPKGAIVVRGAREHNLRNVDVTIPIGVMVAVTGVSGAGKSSLVNGILLPALSRLLHKSTDTVGDHDRIDGLDAIDKVIAIDQKPIGRTPRSNPGTYTKVFDEIRNVFAELPDARARGFDSGRFSFNVKGGRCEACGGDGVVKVEMHFLADVFVPCEVCAGKRYDEATLSIRYKGKNIADVLETTIEECRTLFSPYPKIAAVLGTLVDVGLGYVKLGQPAPTLSGGEAQRVKLSRELAKQRTGRTLYVLDEPTTGLHFEDVRRLLEVLDALVAGGNTVVVVEHDLDVVQRADYVIDLGPEGGAGGGLIVAEGTPEAVARVKGSYTGRYLAERFAKSHEAPKPKAAGRGRLKAKDATASV